MAATLFLVFFIFIFFTWISFIEAFPVFQYANARFNEQLLEVGVLSGIAKEVSTFLWDRRGLDLLIQAFVIVATVISCMAMLKPGREE
jgi:hypothetical protein